MTPSPRSRKWLLLGEYYASDGVYLDEIIHKGTLNQCEEAMMGYDYEYNSFEIIHETELEADEDEEDDL